MKGNKRLTCYNKLSGMVPAKVHYANKSTSIRSNMSNIVSAETLRRVQLETLEKISNCLANTFGPMGSNTKIITGSDANSIVSAYTKDGHKTLKHVLFSNPLEMSIQAEVEEVTRHVEHEVGDGTTSATILSYKIYGYLVALMEGENYRPYEIVETFKKAVDLISKKILEKGKLATIQDIYNICMISTNGNVDISKRITEIYDKYGLGVNIDVSVSNTGDHFIKVYDGLTINEGYSDPSYINNVVAGTCEIHDAHIYAFLDPVDDMNMISLFERIVINNIIDPINEQEEVIPTVIIAPRMSRDMSGLMGQFIEVINSFPANQKPPLLVITDISGSDEDIYLDIAKLCGCKYIRKYIDPEIKKVEEEKGLAANLDNVCSFCGKAELVVSDVGKTKFVNPACMKETNEKGEKVFTKEYNALLQFLKSELNHAKVNGEDSASVGRMKKRIQSLEANLVEYFVGGITIADRDQTRDLVVDAVKNCSSATKYGVGRAANFEGLMASIEVYEVLEDSSTTSELQLEILRIIFNAYASIVEMLYATSIPLEQMKEKIDLSVEQELPIDLRTGNVSDKVVSSIMSDVKILDAISKLITLMGTSNQCLLQAPQLNVY